MAVMLYTTYAQSLLTWAGVLGRVEYHQHADHEDIRFVSVAIIREMMRDLSNNNAKTWVYSNVRDKRLELVSGISQDGLSFATNGHVDHSTDVETLINGRVDHSTDVEINTPMHDYCKMHAVTPLFLTVTCAGCSYNKILFRLLHLISWVNSVIHIEII